MGTSTAEDPPIWTEIDCAKCGGAFADSIDWDVRHSSEDGDVHADCCNPCPGSAADTDLLADF